MSFVAGQDVWVLFDDVELRGEVVSCRNGWVQCRVIVDPVMDFGSITDRLAPVSVVMVRDDEVRPVEVE